MNISSTGSSARVSAPEVISSEACCSPDLALLIIPVMVSRASDERRRRVRSLLPLPLDPLESRDPELSLDSFRPSWAAAVVLLLVSFRTAATLSAEEAALDSRWCPPLFVATLGASMHSGAL